MKFKKKIFLIYMHKNVYHHLMYQEFIYGLKKQKPTYTIDRAPDCQNIIC
jgi:hypothetical protein